MALWRRGKGAGQSHTIDGEGHREVLVTQQAAGDVCTVRGVWTQGRRGAHSWRHLEDRGAAGTLGSWGASFWLCQACRACVASSLLPCGQPWRDLWGQATVPGLAF